VAKRIYCKLPGNPGGDRVKSCLKASQNSTRWTHGERTLKRAGRGVFSEPHLILRTPQGGEVMPWFSKVHTILTRERGGKKKLCKSLMNAEEEGLPKTY